MFRTVNLTVIELDKKYKIQRARIDETIAFFELYDLPVAKDTKTILQPMFEFWFNLRIMLEQERNRKQMQSNSDADVTHILRPNSSLKQPYQHSMGLRRRFRNLFDILN